MILHLLCAMLLTQNYYSEHEARDLFDKANEAYLQHHYAEAQENYLKLVEHGYASSTVLYNLGTSYLAAGDIGRASVYLEKARQASSEDDIESNLNIAASQNIDQLVGETQAHDPLPARFARMTAGPIWEWVLLASPWAVLLLWATRRMWPERLSLLRSTSMAIAALMLLCAGTVVGSQLWTEANFRQAIVVAQSIKVREAPSESAPVAFEIHAGLKMRVLSNEGDYIRVRLRNGLEGWVLNTGVANL